MKTNLLILTLVLGSLINQSYSQQIWGMTRDGGDSNNGVLFKADANGENPIVEFSFDGINGIGPTGGVIHASNGNLYGLVYGGGSNSKGVLFEYNPYSQSFSKKYDFDGTAHGANPRADLMEAADSKLYGMTRKGGSNYTGVIFSYDPLTNTYSKLHDFDGLLNGSNPWGNLIEVENGKLYGMTPFGGLNGEGILFEYNYLTNTFSKKQDFNASVIGANPYGTLLKASNGKLYGLCINGGTNSEGTLFEYDYSSNTITKKADFQGVLNGAYPTGSLMEASNGKLYGTTSSGGSGAGTAGVIFDYDINSNILTERFDLNGTLLGYYPAETMLEASNGMLYGTTYQGGANNYGVIYEFNPSTNVATVKFNFDRINGENPLYGILIELDEETYTWSGNTSEDWNQSNNWEEGSVPGNDDYVVIPTDLSHYPTLTSAQTIHEITLKSKQSSESSLKGQEQLTVTNNVRVERYISEYTNNSNGWHFLSSAVSSQPIAGSDYTPITNEDDLFQWEESIGEWQNYFGANFSDTQFEVGKAYLVAYSSTDTKEFTGSFNTGSVTKNLTFNAGMGDGYNLIGNPYPSAIDWDLITKSGDVDNAAYIVNPVDGTYKSWVDGAGDITNGEIPVNQGFFVKANSGGQSVTMELADQVHSDNNFNKSSDEQAENTLKVSLIGTNSSNNTYVRLKASASNQFDSQSDAYKLFGFAEIPQVYTHLNDVDYSINSVNLSPEPVSIPLGIYLNADEDLSLEFNEINTFNDNIRIELEDQIENKIINLKDQNTYSFRGTSSDEAERFLLHFSQVTSVENIEAQEVQVYATDGRVYIRLEEGANYSQMAIFDLSGRLLTEQNLNKQSLQSFEMNELKGVYLVQLMGDNISVTEKVTL